MIRINLKDKQPQGPWTEVHRDVWLRTYGIWARQRRTPVVINKDEFWIEFEEDMYATLFVIDYPHNR